MNGQSLMYIILYIYLLLFIEVTELYLSGIIFISINS